MDYTVSQLAKLSGVSPRTLRYYDEIDLLNPHRLTQAGYRLYGEDQVNRLQQILFYKTMDIPLEAIRSILDDKDFDPVKALDEHKSRLLKKQKHINQLLKNIEDSMNALKGGNKMTDQSKFEGFNEELIRDNEEKYGQELRGKYGDKVIDESNDKIRKMTKDSHSKAEKLGLIIKEKLKEGFEDKDIKGALAKEIYELHREWIMCYWSSYSKEAHMGLGDMYVADERFKAYYDDDQAGSAQYLRDIIRANAHE